ncbi:MAG TPA: Uma2 family endonuclease [Pyrinomonadaceae bacterium]|nr:Uma2 family endonuclease [Pyrinomonadaceae bacterium]
MSQTSIKNKKLMTVEEYLRFEERSKYKHEYIDGETIRLHDSGKDAQMAGNRASHVFIVSNLCFYLRLALQKNGKPCQVGTTEMRVLLRDNHYAYPDVFAVCGEFALVPNIFDTLENPVVIFEVLSKSTEIRDRGDKAVDYRNLASLTDYILVSQNKMRVEQQTRQDDGTWKILVFEKPEDKIFFATLECGIIVTEIYENIKFPPQPHLKLVESKKKNGK